MGQRRPTPFRPELEALLEERIELRIRLSLMERRPHGLADDIASIKKRLREIEQSAAQLWKNPNS